jgi:prepilin-type N-terminal cleavage/methylation domain-containing protein
MLTRVGRRRHRAFTIVELLIVMAIVAVIAAVLYPTVAGQLRSGRSAALGDQLNHLRDAIDKYKQNVQFYPRQLTQLTQQPGAGALQSCAGALPGPNMAMWRGPYLGQNIVGNFPVGDAQVQSTTSRNPPTIALGPIGLLQISVISVDSVIAVDLEAQFDGNNNFATGSILWGPTSPDIGTITFRIPIRGC